MSLNSKIAELVSYGIDRGLIEKSDKYYTVNRMIKLFGKDDFDVDIENIESVEHRELEEILGELCDIAFDMGIIEENTVTYRDLFDTELMAVMVKRPSEVTKEFYEKYKNSPKEATDYYFNLSKSSDYIRTYRVAKDMKWKVDSEFGEIDITINLSKPEKDPKAIAAAKNATSVSYPACQLCMENEGYAGRINHPARGNHRVIPIEINGDEWGFQYSPYVYYNEHCIVFNQKHVPMQIDKDVFMKLLGFVEKFPHYFVGSNADLPIVGGSILSHEHFQGGNYEFAMAKAGIEKSFKVEGYDGVECGIVHWPLSVIRLRGKDAKEVSKLAAYILEKFRNYTDEEAFIFAKTDGELHNTITPIARMRGEEFELDLALRNNITTKEHPLGVYHPHEKLHNIKKENIGLIEVMGLAVLPSRLKTELMDIAKLLSEGKDISEKEELKKHVEWVLGFKDRCEGLSFDEILEIVKEETGKVFVEVLKDAGIFKCDETGRKYFDRFIKTL